MRLLDTPPPLPGIDVVSQEHSLLTRRVAPDLGEVAKSGGRCFVFLNDHNQVPPPPSLNSKKELSPSSRHSEPL